MIRTVLNGKIHRVAVTGADLNYVGSITVDPVLLEAANMQPFEKVQVVNVTNGNRWETYIILGEPGAASCRSMERRSLGCPRRHLDSHDVRPSRGPNSI